MAEQDIITAARYNLLQARIATIMGDPSDNEGYGQQLESETVAVTQIVRADDINGLYADMIRARKHQTGNIPNTISSVLSGDTINDSDNAPYDTTSFTAFEQAMEDIEADKFLLALPQATVESLGSATRGPGWTSTIYLEFSLNFTGYTTSNGTAISAEDHRRAFFNAGGQVYISPNLSGGSGNKTRDWQDLLSKIAQVRFNYTSTEADAGTGSAIGNYDLTTSYKQLFVKQAELYPVYNENNFKVYAKKLSNSEIQFKVEFNDDDTGDRTGAGPAVDEAVTGNTSVTIQVLRPSGTSVDVPAPSYFERSAFN
jgi:hypothetical protein